MQPYTRNIKRSLHALRLLLIVMILTCAYLFTHDLYDYGYLIIMVAVTTALVPLAGIEVNNNVLVIKKYYLFALLCKTKRFYKTDNPQLQLFEIELMDAGDEAGKTGLLSLFLFTMPYKATIEKVTITKQTTEGKEVEVTIRLESTEYRLLQNFCQQPSAKKNREFDAPGFSY